MRTDDQIKFENIEFDELINNWSTIDPDGSLLVASVLVLNAQNPKLLKMLLLTMALFASGWSIKDYIPDNLTERCTLAQRMLLDSLDRLSIGE